MTSRTSQLIKFDEAMRQSLTLTSGLKTTMKPVSPSRMTLAELQGGKEVQFQQWCLAFTFRATQLLQRATHLNLQSWAKALSEQRVYIVRKNSSCERHAGMWA